MVTLVNKVEGPILEKVISFCTHRHKSQTTRMTLDESNEWKEAFLDVDKVLLFALIRAAYFLEIEPLTNLTCKAVADMLSGKTSAQINLEFAIPDGARLY